MTRLELFWWCLYGAVLCVVIAWLWGQAKEADDRFERDETFGVDQIREQRIAELRAQQGEPIRRHALKGKL